MVTFLNYLLSRTPESVKYWSEAYLPSVFSKFSDLDSLPAYACNPWELLAAIEYHCGLSLQLTGSERLFEDCCPFKEEHVLSIPFRVKLLLPPCLGSFIDILSYHPPRNHNETKQWFYSKVRFLCLKQTILLC